MSSMFRTSRPAPVVVGVLGLVLAVPLWAAPARAGSGGALEIVLDSSGSMGGQDPSGGLKLDAARRAVTGMLAALPDSTTVGVRAYGGHIVEVSALPLKSVLPFYAVEQVVSKSEGDE